MDEDIDDMIANDIQLMPGIIQRKSVKGDIPDPDVVGEPIELMQIVDGMDGRVVDNIKIIIELEFARQHIRINEESDENTGRQNKQ